MGGLAPGNTMRLTAKLIENLPLPQPPKDRIEIPDDLLTGLYLVLWASGTITWSVRYRFAGRGRKYTIPGRSISLADARRLAREVLFQVAQGVDPGALKARARADTVEAVVELFLERHVRQHTRPRSIAESERILRRAVAAWRGRPIASISRRDVVAYIDRVADVSGPVAANRAKAVISKLFSWSVTRDIVPANPAAGLPRFSPEPPRDRVLSAVELGDIWRACSLLGYPYGPFIQLLILTAARRTEVSALPWAEIDLTSRLWRLPAARSKNAVELEIPLSGPAMAILEGLPRLGPYVFTVSGASSIQGFSQVKKALDALLPDDMAAWTFHDLRRSAATHMADKLGVAPHIVSACLGHLAGDRVARVYNRARYATEKREALERWATFVTGLAEERSSVIPLRAGAGA
jgi:integrase